MQVKYNVTGARRKELVKVIADTTGAKAEYKFMPTCNYEIDYFTVTKDGSLLFDDRADSEEVEQVLEAIAAAGFDCEPQDGADSEAEEVSNPKKTRHRAKTRGLRWRFRSTRYRSATSPTSLDSKGTLIKKALGIEDIRFEIKDDRVAFPGLRNCRTQIR